MVTLAPLLDEDAAAALLDVSPRTLQDWRFRGGGPRFCKIGRVVRYRPRDLERFIEARVRCSTSDPGTEPAGAPA